MIYLTRRATFSASHYYRNPAWTEEKNRQVFGACANPNGHGHNYTLEVTVAGNPDPVHRRTNPIRGWLRVLALGYERPFAEDTARSQG